MPDQRGYNLSDKPKGVANYKMDTLVDDIFGLADTLGYDRFHLAGHDFGAMVGWNLAMRNPKRVKRLAIANIPHPSQTDAEKLVCIFLPDSPSARVGC